MQNASDRDFWDIPLQDLLSRLKATPTGLTSSEANARLAQYGPNSLTRESKFYELRAFFRFFLNPLVLILLAASIVSVIVGDVVNASIIIGIVFLSVCLNFYQEFQARRAVDALKKQVASTANVIRDGKAQELPVELLVPGDVIALNAGDLVPADCRLLDVKDLHVRESALTGESLPVEKTAAELSGGYHNITDSDNSVFMGTSVESGMGTAIIVETGSRTEFGAIAAELAKRPPETEFDRGMKTFGMMITRVIMILVLFVFLVSISHLHRGGDTRQMLLQAFLFALALAVGLTPELLPVIISITLAQGAKRMAAKKVIVKQLASIENFGSMEILCSDKTGTLTEDDIVLDKHVDVEGKDDDSVLQLVYVNSYFEAGIKSPLDAAILKHEHPTINEFTKIDEIPFDFTRRRLSVVTQDGGARLLITKGAAEQIFDVCSSVRMGGKDQAFTDDCKKTANATHEALSREGYRVLGVAIRIVPVKDTYSRADETDMTLVGFAAFLDPAKPGVGDMLNALKKDGLSVVIMTGDNQFVTQKIAQEVGLKADLVIVGSDVDKMDDAALARQALQGAIFARVSPEQKNRVIMALKSIGKVVGFMGDGINDAPSLHAADIGISVVNAVDVAKEAASIILLEKDLGVLNDGIVEGRRSFANILKYIIMGTSSNFGNMFSMAAATLFLPFLPMLPTQILLNNLLYDISQIAIPSDNVEPALLRQPRRWRIDFVRQFMVIIGPISSVYDLLTFGTLVWIFHAKEVLFHTGWFVESLATQTLVVFVIRTAGNPFKSRPSRQLVLTVLAIVAIGFILPSTPIAHWLGMSPLPWALQGIIIFFTVTYMALVQLVKLRFYRKHDLI
jgi:Mg2+-importing ATPase